MESVTVIARSFQGGKSEETFDMGAFSKHVEAFKNILNCSNVERLIVVTCGEGKHSEIPDTNGLFPTIKFLTDVFGDDIKSGRMIVHVNKNWGNNPGSGEALNDGLKIAHQNNAKWIINWSPEMECNEFFIYQALTHAEKYDLICVGGLRQKHWEKPQYRVPQNTLALWRVDVLKRVSGFAPECNGTGEMVYTVEFGDVELAGMEDFHTLLRIMRDEPNHRWGMVRRVKPFKWDTNFEPGSKREMNHKKKVARQYAVMRRYVEMVFPDSNFEDVMDQFFGNGHND